MQRRSARCKRTEELNIGHNKNSEYSKMAKMSTIATDNVSLPQKKYLRPYIKTANRVAEVARGHRGPPPKRLDSDENFKSEHTLFCREL